MTNKTPHQTLKSLTVSRNESWEKNPGAYTATVCYESEKGGVTLNLDEAVSEALLLCIGDVLTEFAKRAADEVSNNLLASVAEARQLPVVNETEAPCLS